MLASFFGPAAAGFFALTRSALAAPAALVGQSVGSVFYSKAVDLYDKPAELKRVLLKATYSLIALGGLVFSPFLLQGPGCSPLCLALSGERQGSLQDGLPYGWSSHWLLDRLSAPYPCWACRRFFGFRDYLPTAEILVFIFGCFF